MEFSEKIRLLRRKAGMTQKQVAEKIGVTYRTYQNYEAGASLPSGSVVSKLASALGVSADTLLRDGKAPSPRTSDRKLNALLAEMQALFSGGKLREEDKEYVLEALTEAYWLSKKSAPGTDEKEEFDA